MSVIAVTTLYTVCPHCQQTTTASIEHLPPGTPFGPWYCHACGRAYTGVANGAGTTVTPHSDRMVPTLDLLKLDTPEGPFYFIIEGKRFEGRDARADEAASKQFYYEEHSCPTNWLRQPLMMAHGGNTDPHGSIEFVRHIDKPETWPEDANDEDRRLEGLFPEITERPVRR